MSLKEGKKAVSEVISAIGLKEIGYTVRGNVVWIKLVFNSSKQAKKIAEAIASFKGEFNV